MKLLKMKITVRQQISYMELSRKQFQRLKQNCATNM